jgi:hypothetical protein
VPTLPITAPTRNVAALALLPAELVETGECGSLAEEVVLAMLDVLIDVVVRGTSFSMLLEELLWCYCMEGEVVGELWYLPTQIIVTLVSDEICILPCSC